MTAARSTSPIRLPFAPRGPSGQGDSEANDILAWVALWHDPSLPAIAPSRLDHHLPVGDLVTSRNGWGAGDYLLAIKSGFNNRSHGHLDAGALAFAYGDTWLITTPGYGTGSGQADFWDSNGPRWNYFSNRTESHSTLVIDGGNQSFDRANARGRVTAFVTTPHTCWTEIDLSAAYTGLDDIRRQVLHRRDAYVLVLDRVRDAEPHRVEWLVQVPPAARAEGAVVTASAAAGALRIEMLAPARPWCSRQPDTNQVDVASERLQTWAVAEEGAAVEFAVLLVPQPAGSPRAEVHATVERAGECRVATVRGAGWTDTVVLGETVASLVAAPVTARASGLVVRRGSEGLASVFALDAERVDLGAFAIEAATPAVLELRRLAAEVWRVDAPAPPRLIAGEGWTLAPWPVEAGFADAATSVVYRGSRAAMLRALASSSP